MTIKYIMILLNSVKFWPMNKFSDFGISTGMLIGDKMKVEDVLNLDLEVHNFQIKDSKHPKPGFEKCLHLQIRIGGVDRVLFTSSTVLLGQIQKIPKNGLPFSAKIVKNGKSYQFTG